MIANTNTKPKIQEFVAFCLQKARGRGLKEVISRERGNFCLAEVGGFEGEEGGMWGSRGRKTERVGALACALALLCTLGVAVGQRGDGGSGKGLGSLGGFGGGDEPVGRGGGKAAAGGDERMSRSSACLLPTCAQL